MEELGTAINAVSFRQLDEYNRAKIASERFERQVRAREHELTTAADRATVRPAPVQALSNWWSPYYVRADSLSQRYQMWYYALGNAVFLLAAAAVAAAASQVVFAPQTPELVCRLKSGTRNGRSGAHRDTGRVVAVARPVVVLPVPGRAVSLGSSSWPCRA